MPSVATVPTDHTATPANNKIKARLKYNVSKHLRSLRGSLVDRGANGGILGNDAKVIHVHMREVDVTGIDNHELNALKLVDATAKVMTQLGPVIGIFRQYAYHGINRSIHSSGQFEAYKNKVDDRSMKVGGKQCINTNDGYVIPLDIINGLPYLKMQPNTDSEFADLPHVIFTSGDEWNPTILDNTLTDKDDWYNTIKDIQDGLLDTPFDEYGNYRKRTVPIPVTIIPPIPNGDVDDPGTPDINDNLNPDVDNDDLAAHIHDSHSLRSAFNCASMLNSTILVQEATLEEATITDDELANLKKLPPIPAPPKPFVTPKKIDYDTMRPYFLHVDIDKIRMTFDRTTQFATNVMSGHNIMQTIQSPFPAHNVWRRNEAVASDTIFAAVPAIGTNGQTMAQIFIGRTSLVIDIYGMSTEKQFVNTLEDVIRKRGAMDKLITDSARVEISKRVGEILRALAIDDWQSEPNYQHQNHAERRWKFFKLKTQWFMNWRNVPGYAWLLCAEWVADVMNHTSEVSLKGRPPLEVLTGQTVDISILLCFLFWDVVYVSRYNDSQYKGQVGSTKSSEIRGRFVGFSHHVGHALTFKILTDDTQKVIHRSRVRLCTKGENNLKLDIESGEVPERIFIKSNHDSKEDDVILPTIDLTNNPFNVPDEHLPHVQNDLNNGEQHIEEPTDTALPNEHGEQPNESSTDDGEQSTPTDDGEQPNDTPVMDLPSLKDTREPIVETVYDNDPPPDIGDKSMFDLVMESLRTDGSTIPNLPPEEMIDRSFLMPPTEDGSRVRAKIVQRVNDYKARMSDDPDNAAALARFRCIVDGKYEEVVAYNDIVDYIEQDDSWDGVWKFKEILDHKVVKTTDSSYKGSRYNLQILWETGEITWEPLTTKDKVGVYDSDPVTVAIYAEKHKLLDTPGWKLPGLKKRAKTQKRLLRVANQAKLHSFRTKPIYMYGYLVPRNHTQALELDDRNGNTKWADATSKELREIDEYETFNDKGKGYRPPPDYKKIRVHLIFAVKHDGRHKARLVAGGHLTDTPIDSVYSSVVSLRGIRIITFLAELNGCESWSTDVSCAYLESYTQERVYIVAGPEFGDREGHTLIIVRALYGLRSSGLRWSQRFADVLREMGFFLSKADKDIWMRDKGDHYEYIAVYVDDLLIASRNPQDIISALEGPHHFRLKGSGPITFHLGCDFFRDENGHLCYAPVKYIEKMVENYIRIFGKKPKDATSPLVKGDHPELDTTDLLEDESIKIYQSLIGALQWVIQIGRFDLATAVMTMSRFRAAPRTGHMDRVKRIHGYISKMRHGIIRIRTEEPDHSDIPEIKYDWEHTCYRGAKEEVDVDSPKPLGKRVIFTSYVDANLYHDLLNGKSVTGILHMANQTVIDYFSKLQSTVETATFGSEYVAARTCTEQIIDIRTTFRYLGVPITHATVMFGDNESVVNTASMPHSKLNKRHNALSYHKTRSCISASILRFVHISGASNPADILSKHWDYASVWKILRPLMFVQGKEASTPPIDAIKDYTKLILTEKLQSKVATEGSNKESIPTTT